MSQEFDNAMAALRATGNVTLPGRPAAWSAGSRAPVFTQFAGVIVVFLALLSLYIFGLSRGLDETPWLIIGAAVLLAVFALVTVGMTYELRRRRTYRAFEYENVTIDRVGLTLRGVGPIPWADVGPAARQFTASERHGAILVRAVMPLTPTGKDTVNRRLETGLRERISGAIGMYGFRDRWFLNVPGIDGLKERETIELINTARTMFGTPNAGS